MKKTFGTERKLLLEKTNITSLVSAGGRLFCYAFHPTIVDEWGAEQIDMYLLDEEGQVADYWDDTEGNSGYGMTAYGDKLLVWLSSIYSQDSFTFLYDPATGARFPAQSG